MSNHSREAYVPRGSPKGSFDLKPLPQAHAPLACINPSDAMPFDNSILTISHRKNLNTTKAIIVGGGIAGLSLALMMELAGIEYEILERYTGDEPDVGSGLVLGPPVLRLLEQMGMGLLEEVEKVSKASSGLTVYDPEGRRLGRFEGVEKERYGYHYLIMPRPAFHKILLDRVPKANIRFGKQVIETLQNPNGVSCKCSDGSTYYGDIIVGADGAQSLTRERMFKQLSDQGKLPEADADPSVYEHVCISGVSDELDKNAYPAIVDETAEFQVIFNKKAFHSFWYMPIPGNRIAWSFYGVLPTPKQRPRTVLPTSASFPPIKAPLPPSRTSSSHSTVTLGSKIYDDWLGGSSDAEEHLQGVKEAICPAGPGSVGDFLKHTPKERVTHIDMGERLYKTWHHGRIVLIGDACHQHLLVGAQAAIQCMLDGVCLVNLLYDMEHNSPNEISKVFKKYQAKRSGIARSSIEETAALDKVFHGQGLVVGMKRKFLFNNTFTFSMANDAFNNNRPQLSFLPFVEDRATSKAYRQKVSSKLARNQNQNQY
ncbi:hypothetical protein BGZ80_005951 [Entomortierella chlamydospora]|uniref:FAD-binding domain-containing protein n=1 Tax=Entomortierella chlamydospora TaxID=101097 RepID=A0A9P6SU96_9FUNG|nr:hypothetical protein BGZ79_001375 [Entomortierella chlamydospora]KAG0002572.1 hypothetical protein BGZ80_005951 [Entomortierella chlamydospora]